MSRIGNAPIVLPQGVELNISEDNIVTVKGPLGELTQKVDKQIIIERNDNSIHFKRTSEAKEVKSKHGLYRALVMNMVVGVTQGYKKTLVINGVGYKAAVSGNKLTLNVGFSHPVEMVAVDGISLSIPKNNHIDVSGISKELVGQFASNIRDIKPVEPYHAYGIRYSDEVVIRKEGKTAKK